MNSRGSQTSERKKRAQPTIDDVAMAAGVSTATISRSLNEPDRVSAKTRDRVMAAIDRLGYQPNFSAKSLAANRSGTVGAIIPTMDNAIFARGLQAFQEELGQQGYTLLVASSSYRRDLEAQQIRNLVARGVDALMLIGHDRDQGVYEFLRQRDIPFVNAWTYNNANDAFSVGFDNKAAMEDLAERIIALGHKKLGVISAPRADNDRARERVEGLISVAERAGLNASDIPVLEVNYSIANGAEAFEQLMARDDQPTAVICGNDVLAVGALGRSKTMGLKVPGDVSITGFDDIELAQISEPSLTTIHVPHRKMGRHAAKLLVTLMAGKEAQRRVKLSTDLVMRASLGPVSTQRM